MKYLYLLLLFAFASIASYGQGINDNIYLELGKTAELTRDQQEKMDAAFTMLDVVQKAGNYVQSLSELISNSQIPLPVGIKSDNSGYELIIHEIIYDEQTRKNRIYATCAFKFKDSNQPIAFEGEATLTGKNGIGTTGRLTLIAPVRRDIGRHSSIIVKEGTSATFGCNGIEQFDAKLAWLATSDKITAVNPDGTPTGKPLGVSFDAHFEDFDNYLATVDVNQRFMLKGLDDMIFTLRGATIDQSDTENAGMMHFPNGYFGATGAAVEKLWRGVAIAEASVSLPAFFRMPETKERAVLALREALFDENGFSGNASAENIIPSSAISRESWDASLTGFSINVLKNSVIGFGLSGDLNIPPFGKNSLLPYVATFNPLRDEYEFRANVSGAYDFPVLRSTLTLNELTTIKIQYRDSELYPTIDATGKLTVNAPVGSDSTKVFSVPDISFENLILSREAPYVRIGRIGVEGSLRAPSIAGFELSLSDINSFNDADGTGLKFTGKIGLTNQTPSISGDASIKLLGNYEKWKFDRIVVDKVNVSYESSAFSLSGGVWFRHGDAIYGDGFRGDIRLKLIRKFDFDAVGIFGKKDDFRYFLADVFYQASVTNGIPIPPAFSLYGFGGGLYQRMQQSGKSQNPDVSSGKAADLNFGQSLSGINYVPDKKVGFGLMSSAKFALKASETAFNAKVGFEMQFNSRGGLNFVQLRGDAAFMDAPEKWGTLADNLGSYVSKVGGKEPQKGNKSELGTPENRGRSLLSASLLFEYDNVNDRFNADMSAYLNAYGIIRGVGPNDRLGWANAYISPESWHLYMGTPSERLGIEVLKLAKLDGYFMLGSNIPELPPPPNNVLMMLSSAKRDKLNSRSADKLESGRGIAFGASFQTGLDASFLIFYARMHLGLGTEFMLTSLRGKTCEGVSGDPGLNGWFAQAQAWAYVDADIGLQARVFGKRRRFSILDISAAVLLEGKGPNPFWFAGSVGGRYRVLGGLIKGNCNFEFELGKECKLVGGSPFGEDIIAQLTPGEGDRDVNVFAAPQAVFNIAVNQEMTIDDEDGSRGTYKAVLEEFTVKYKQGNQTVSRKQEINKEGTICMLSFEEPLESQKDVELYAKVGFMKKQGNNWIAVKDNGKPVYEEKRATFRTGDRPKEILPEHVAYTYPLDRQYNFYPKEHNQGYLLLTKNYSYLFTSDKPQGYDQKLRITAGNEKIEKSFSYSTGSSVKGVQMEITFPLDNISLKNNAIYSLAIVNIPQTSGSMTSNISETTTQLENTETGTAEITRRTASGALSAQTEMEIYKLSFRTSRYNTFADKIRSFEKPSEGWRDVIYPYIHLIKTNLREPELFDAYEMGSPNVNIKTITLSAQVNQTEWFTQTLYDGMYQSQSYLARPVDKVAISQSQTSAKLLTDEEITLNTPMGYGTTGILCYSLAKHCAEDLFTAKNEIGRRALKGGSLSAAEIAILNRDYPPVVFKGNYPVKASYTLPGRNTVSSEVIFTMYNPVASN
ncbi:MAG: hypothetical protein LBD45_02800 [Bacteroidales bacterium]|jgi:hypothetical protein|nr:hypothetical protein [Bacteroidales bacterium]